MANLVLASTSPRRKELLQQIGVSFTQLSIDINEDVASAEKPEEYVLRLAKEKAAGRVCFALSQRKGGGRV